VIVLVGFMGAGKSTVGRLLAEEMDLPFVDTDALVEERAGAPIAEVFEASGEAAFRSMERSAVADVLRGPDAVVALGGGALGDRTTRAALRDHTVVYLETSFEDVLARTGGDTARPLLGTGDPRLLFDHRVPVYELVADLTVSTSGCSARTVAVDLAEALRAAGERAHPAIGGARAVPGGASGRPYDVVVGSGVAGDLADLLLPGGYERAFLVTHKSLRAPAERTERSLERGGTEVVVLDVEEGERSKSLESAANLYAELANHAAHRNELVIGLGGGVVCDLAGFVASTYNRGMDVAHVPTTLLAQVDAAIGGKTAVNLPAGKNLIGTFHQPVTVVCDVDFLAGLPDAELRSGLAEVVKYGFIAAPALLDLVTERAVDLFARDEKLLVEVIAQSVSVKAAFVAEDEKDRGRRALLNYGHTFAHAIESASGYAGIRHGEAVALGMMAAAHLAREMGRVDDEVVTVHRRVLESVGLPVSASLDPDALADAWLRDKKYEGEVRFVLLTQLGAAEAGVSAPRDKVRRALESLRS
jgi:shikimate kinase / 3-dehydroquinate synthase